jgi:hypothetical protein
MSPHFTPIWKTLISTHSQLLTQMNIGLGEQHFSSQEHPLKQLLGIYYLALALHSSLDKPMLDKSTIELLHKAVTCHSMQALLLLRNHYFSDPNNIYDNFESFDEFIIFMKNICKPFLAPGYIAYGEILMHFCKYFLNNKTHNYIQNTTPSHFSNLFNEGVLHCFIGASLEEISETEINNAYGVTTGKIPYQSQNGVFYETMEDQEYEDMDDYCRYMRSLTHAVVNWDAIKAEALRKAEEIITNMQYIDETFLLLTQDQMVNLMNSVFAKSLESPRTIRFM